MLKVTEIAFSCYPVKDMARARKFYEEILCLKPTMVVGEPGGMQWTEYDIANGTLALGCGVVKPQYRSYQPSTPSSSPASTAGGTTDGGTTTGGTTGGTTGSTTGG